MNSVLEQADLSAVDNKQRGKHIEQRRLHMGIGSLRTFAEELGMDRGAVTKAEKGEATERTFARIEAWLNARDHEMSSDAEEAAEHGAQVQQITIKMAGVYGIDDVTISGPIDHLEELKTLAVELMRDVRDRKATDPQ